MVKILESTETRRSFLRASLAAAASAAAAATSTNALAASAVRTASALGPARSKYRERRVLREGHSIYVRDYPGDGPPFVMVHGFPDNCQIYEELAPLLSAAGRRAICFDFLGFGSSDKPARFRYDFNQQLADLGAVIADLGPGPVIPVGHDAGGPAAINYALDHPGNVSALVLLNCYYSSTASLRFPEFIDICADPKLEALGQAMMSDPVHAAWLLHFTQDRFRAASPPSLRAHFDATLQPIVNDNFAKAPSSGPAFLAMANDAGANLAYNSSRVPQLRRFARPVRLIWGTQDPYLDHSLADDLAGQIRHASVVKLSTNHWPQIDAPATVARAMLS